MLLFVFGLCGHRKQGQDVQKKKKVSNIELVGALAAEYLNYNHWWYCIFFSTIYIYLLPEAN